MKGLIIDGAVSKLTIACKNDDKKVSCVYDIGMKQSETLLPAIDYVMKTVGLKTSDLDYTALTVGPGSFTGLRLAISALKAIELSDNVPVYGISTLEAYEYPFEEWNRPVLSVIDANKDRFYARGSLFKSVFLKDGDYDIQTIIDEIIGYPKLLIVGPDAKKLKEILTQRLQNVNIFTIKSQPLTSEAVFELAEKKIQNKEEPLKDYDGPLYLRASEAEIKVIESNENQIKTIN